jgi:small GTP-binding protein
MLGDSGVGKTALVNRMSEGAFTDNYTPTVGSQFVALPLDLGSRQVMLEVWDTAGQEVYRSLVGFYIREAKGAFILVDVTSETSFEGLPEWLKFVHEQAPNAKLVLFANKCDLEEQRTVSRERLLEFANAHKIDLIEGSAKLGQNTADAFEKMGELVVGGQTKAAATITITDTDDPAQEKGGCC